MKEHFFLKYFSIFFIISFCSFLQPKGSIKIDKSDIDLGEIKEGKASEIDFAISNISDKSVRIYSVTTTCGCTIVKYPNSILPKQTIKIHATFDSKGYAGPVKKEIVLVVDDELKYYKLQFVAKVKKQ